MAKATATCTCATCGREFEVSVKRPNRQDADSWAKWASEHYDECSDCYRARMEAEREAANAQAAKDAQEAGLPPLRGSEKQIGWAEAIRQDKLKLFGDILAQYLEVPEDQRIEQWHTDMRHLRGAIAWVSSQDKASWWIDHRDESANKLGRRFMKMLENGEVTLGEEEPADERETREAAQAEMVAAPESQTHDGVVDIQVTEDTVSAQYVKDDDFRAIVKALDYRWNSERSRWCKAIGLTTGAASERAAELGNKLLNAGFAVRIADAETLKKAIDGSYDPQTYRWITTLPDKNLFYITWGRDDDLYKQARALPGAKYDKPGVTVPFKEWRQVEDFARIYDYKFSPGARQALSDGAESVMVVSPAPPKNAEYKEENLSSILNSSADVLEDLKDD